MNLVDFIKKTTSEEYADTLIEEQVRYARDPYLYRIKNKNWDWKHRDKDDD